MISVYEKITSKKTKGLMTGKSPNKRLLWIEAVVFLLLLAIPILNQGYVTNLIGIYLVYGLFALSVDLIWGYTGLFSFGQAAFFGVGAYIIALLKDTHIINMGLLAILIGVLVTTLIASIFAVFLFSGKRPLDGVYLSLVTLAIAFLFERLALDWQTVLGGYNGIPGIPVLNLLGSEFTGGAKFYYLVFGILILTYFILRKVVNSQFGLVLKGIRENEERIKYLGYNTAFIKSIVFVSSAAIAGLAGALYAFQQGFVAPALLGTNLSIEVLLWIALGGRATLIGGIIGVIFIRLFGQVASGYFANFWQLCVGILLVLVIMLFPGGFVNQLILRVKRR